MGGSDIPEPDWTFLGSVGESEYEYWYDSFDDRDYLAGWGDLNAQFYGIDEINQDSSRDDNYYACVVSLADQDPANDGEANGVSTDFPYNSNPGPYNFNAEIGIDWNMFGAYSSSDLQDYSPDTGDKGDYSFSGTITAAAAPSASLSVSYDPNKINKKNPDRTNDEVVWNWHFHKTWWPTDSEARFNETSLSAGSSCRLDEPLDNPDDKDLAKVWYYPEFRAVHTDCKNPPKCSSTETEVYTPNAYLTEYVEKRDL